MKGPPNSAEVVLNGRFTTQPQSGVQRFAAEIVSATDRHCVRNGQWYAMLAPRSDASPPPYSAIRFKTVGRLHGTAWEQLELPLHVRGRFLVNLGNTAPLLVRNQVVVIHDAGIFATPEAYSHAFRLWYKTLQRALAMRSVKIASVSRFARSEVSRYIGIPETNIDIVGESGEHILRVPPEPSVLIRHGLEAGRFVLAVGNLSIHKNLAVLAGTAERLACRGTPLAVAGAIESPIFRTDRSAALERARYLGKVSDGELRALYEAAACFVFPSRYEGFGLPPLEAMSCGCPVVASTAPAVMEACGNAAQFCDPDDARGFEQAVGRLLDDPAHREIMHHRGLDHARSLTWDDAASRLIEIVEQACNDRSETTPLRSGRDQRQGRPTSR